MSFMNPEVDYGEFCIMNDKYGDTMICPAEYRADYEREGYTHEETVTGWFGRLSASGYLDCTDWNGPFNTEAEALEGLKELYGEDEEEDGY